MHQFTNNPIYNFNNNYNNQYLPMNYSSNNLILYPNYSYVPYNSNTFQPYNNIPIIFYQQQPLQQQNTSNQYK